MVEVEVACGKLDKENCAVVVPEIDGKTVSQNVRLKPLESRAASSPSTGCATATSRWLSCRRTCLRSGRKPDCAGKISVLMWLAATALLSLLILPRMKGAVVGCQWALRMHGFTGREDESRALGASGKGGSRR